MSLSRLSPRSNRKGVSRQRQPRAQKADASRHLRLWEAIRRTREELDLWQQQIDQVDGLFAQYIVPREKVLTHAVADVTEQLIHHFSDSSLDIPDQSLLGLWVTENLQSLQGHPFASAQRTHQLSEQWRQRINQDGAVENQLSRLAQRAGSFASEVSNEEAHANQMGEHDVPANTGDDGNDHDSYTSGDASAKKKRKHKHSSSAKTPDYDDDSGSATAENETKEQSINKKVADLESKLSVERLFRQLAKTLHPDKEQNETQREIKHVLMSQCLEARKNKDINTLLQLYCEHVGDLPEELNDNSHNELVEALEAQLKQLQSELRQQRFGDPLHAMIVERYSSAKPEECEKRIRDHAASLDGEAKSLQTLGRQLKTFDGLLDSLDERRAVEQDRLAIDEMTGVFADY